MSATTACIRPPGRGRATTPTLREHGYDGGNPWHDWANAAEGAEDGRSDGWLLVHADKAARMPEEHSETPYMTRRAMEFIRERRAGRPAMVPAPFLHQAALALHRACAVSRNVRRSRHCPPVRSEHERRDRIRCIAPSWSSATHATFARDEVREKVIPTYMGLIKQIDDQMGVLMALLGSSVA